MSDIVRVKVRSRGPRSRRGKSSASKVSKFTAKFPKAARFLRKVKGAIKKHRFFFTMGCCLFAWAILALLFTLFPLLALLYSNSIGHFIRTTIGTLFSLLPFSAGESLFYAFLLFLPIWICFLFSALKRKYALRRIHTKMRRVLLAPISVLLIVLTIFCFAFAPSYQRPAVSDILGLDPENIYDKDLYNTLEYFVNEINKDVNDLSYGNDGSSIMPMKFNELAAEINHTYQSMDEYPNLCPTIGVPAKSFLFSKMMTAFNIGGIYTFYTGEANVNVHVPDYKIPYFTAHESAHAHGIASEDEANFVAFVVCSASTNSYIRYSGHLSALETIVNELNKTIAKMKTENPEYAAAISETVNEILSELNESVRSELKAWESFWSQNRNEVLHDVTDDLNNTYLKSQGEAAGTDSYNYLTALVVNFYKHYIA